MKRILIFALAFLLVSCSGAGSSLTSFALPPTVEVTFNALLPEGTPVGDPVHLIILDEVTGLEFNPLSVIMESSGDRSVSISLDVPAGTLLKYRYARQSAVGSVWEQAADGRAITYRIYLVDGPGHFVHDVVAAWTDLPVSVETGQVSGIVSDAATNGPLGGFVVVAAGLQTTTANDGSFIIAGLPQGLHNVLVFSNAGSFLPFQQGALVAANSETPATIKLNAVPTAAVTFYLTPPADHTAGTPVFMDGNIDGLAIRPLLGLQSDGRYAVTLQLPVGVDLRYKYSLGDGFWNAEHLADGSFSVRQLIIPSGTTALEVDDHVASWSAGSSAPIWFELTAPAQGPLVYLQFNVGGWSTPLPMWPLAEGHWAYKLYSPTNFAEPLEYRYCLDSACTILDASGQTRSVPGNSQELQQLQDTVEAWQ